MPKPVMHEEMEQKLAAEMWLREFMTELNTQDNRITATPYYYQLRCPVRMEASEDNASGFEWKDEEWDTVTDLAQYLKDRYEGEDDEDPMHVYLAEEDMDLDTFIKDFEDLNLWDDVGDDLGLAKTHYRDSQEYKGIFFTEKAIFAHLEQYKYKYPDGTDTYLVHAHRNPELKQLFESIGKLVGVPYERK